MFKTYQIQNDLSELTREFSSKEMSSEKTLIIDYFEDSLADVKPVTRISTSLDGHTKPVLMVRFSPNSKYIASVAGDNTIRIWDALTETAYIKIEYH
jgi:WD40 repeat protein